MKEPILIREIITQRLLELSKDALIYQKHLSSSQNKIKKNTSKKLAVRKKLKPLIYSALVVFNFFSTLFIR